MDSERYGWCIGALVKFALLGAPAAVTLWFWRRRGPDSQTLYYFSWANISAYLLWCAAISFMSILGGTQAYRDWINYSGITATFAFLIPLLSSFGSFVLCLLFVMVKQGERKYVLLSNVLMLILWIVSVVAPN